MLTIEGLEKWYVNTVKLKHAFAGTTPPNPIPLPSVTNIDGLLEGIVTESMEARIEAAIANGYENTTVKTEYDYPLPVKLWEWVGIDEVGGTTLVFNQLAGTGEASVSTTSGHKYYTVINGTASIVDGGSAITIVDNTKDMVIDLTLMFGKGNEPGTTDDFEEIFPGHYDHDDGSILSAQVSTIVSKKADGTVLQTYSVPNEIKSLPGYGWSTVNSYNYIDFANKTFVQNVGRVDLGTLSWTYYTSQAIPMFYGDISDGIKAAASKPVTIGCCEKYPLLSGTTVSATAVANAGYGYMAQNAQNVNCRVLITDSNYTDKDTFAAAMSGVYVYYELATPVVTDISAYLTDDVITEAVPGGIITFENIHGADYRIPVPALIDYVGKES